MASIAKGATTTCPACGRKVRVSEPYAFNGMSRVDMTLSCGHVVPRDKFSAS